MQDERLWLAPGVAANYGPCVDIWAPGASILSASNESDTATMYRSGTSQSVPFVAGAAALLLENQTGAQLWPGSGELSACQAHRACLGWLQHCLGTSQSMPFVAGAAALLLQDQTGARLCPVSGEASGCQHHMGHAMYCCST